MRSQGLKTLYYASAGRLSICVLWWRRITGNGRYANAYVNLGCGTKYVPGMINVDGNLFRKKDIWLDVTLGLPFQDNSLQGIYSSHLLEHLSVQQVRRLLKECHRALKPGGALRLVVPSLEYAIQAYIQDKPASLPDWPDEYRSIGGRFNNLMLCRNQHATLLDFTFLEELLKDAGFSLVYQGTTGNSRHFSACHLQFESDPSLIDVSLYAEAIK
ncbi:MAG TPA: methyltransferase domain-containing protein [Syntrophorhabdales bacterium]|nr:methyltransferase domain-containing protein [Syntrophorhabdales bacterium]